MTRSSKDVANESLTTWCAVSGNDRAHDTRASCRFCFVWAQGIRVQRSHCSTEYANCSRPRETRGDVLSHKIMVGLLERNFFSGYLTSRVVCLAVFQAIRGSICKRFRRIHNQMGPRTNECYHRLPDGEDLWLEINDVSELNIENLRSELQCFRKRTALIKLSPTVRCECKNIFGKNVRSIFPTFTVILAGRVEKNERTHSGKQRVD